MEDKNEPIFARFRDILGSMPQKELKKFIKKQLDIQNKYNKQLKPMQGWQCPLCKVVHSPLKGSCDCQNKLNKITC